MKHLKTAAIVIGLLASFVASYLAYQIRNPIAAAAAVLVSAVLTTVLARRYFATVVAGNLKKAENQPALRRGPLYLALRLALAAVTLGVGGGLYVSQNQADFAAPRTLYALAGALFVAGVVSGGVVIALFRFARVESGDDT